MKVTFEADENFTRSLRKWLFEAEENSIKQCQGAVNWGRDVGKEESCFYLEGGRWDESQLNGEVATLYTF
jgi:hypothetical protein